MSLTRSAGSDRMWLPIPQSYRTANRTEAIHSPDGHLIQPSIQPLTHWPSWSTSTDLGGSNLRINCSTLRTVDAR